MYGLCMAILTVLKFSDRCRMGPWESIPMTSSLLPFNASICEINMKQHHSLSKDSGMVPHILISKCNASHRWNQRQKHGYHIRYKKSLCFSFFEHIIESSFFPHTIEPDYNFISAYTSQLLPSSPFMKIHSLSISRKK